MPVRWDDLLLQLGSDYDPKRIDNFKGKVKATVEDVAEFFPTGLNAACLRERDKRCPQEVAISLRLLVGANPTLLSLGATPALQFRPVRQEPHRKVRPGERKLPPAKPRGDGHL